MTMRRNVRLAVHLGIPKVRHKRMVVSRGPRRVIVLKALVKYLVPGRGRWRYGACKVLLQRRGNKERGRDSVWQCLLLGARTRTRVVWGISGCWQGAS